MQNPSNSKETAFPELQVDKLSIASPGNAAQQLEWLPSHRFRKFSLARQNAVMTWPTTIMAHRMSTQ